jgi:hypothetical protein
MDLIDLDQDRVTWQTFMGTAMNLRFLLNAEKLTLDELFVLPALK